MKGSLVLVLSLAFLVIVVLGGLIWFQKSTLPTPEMTSITPTVSVEKNELIVVKAIPETLKGVDFFGEGTIDNKEAIDTKGVIISTENGGQTVWLQIDYQNMKIQASVEDKTDISEADFTLNSDGSIESLSVSMLDSSVLTSLKPGEYVRVTFMKSDLSEKVVPLKEFILIER